MKVWNRENLYAIMISESEIKTELNGEIISQLFTDGFGYDTEFWRNSVFVCRPTAKNRLLIIAINSPTSDDAFILMQFLEEMSAAESSRMLMILDTFDMGVLSTDEAEKRAEQIIEEIMQFANNDDSSHTPVKYVLSKYRTLDDAICDSLADKKAKVFSYKHFYYTMSCGGEFRMVGACVSQAFLNEHAKSLGTVAELRSTFGLRRECHAGLSLS